MIELDADAMRLVDAALAEDVGAGDWTTLWTLPADRRAEARIVAKAPGIVAGLAVARAVFLRLDPGLDFHAALDDGARVAPGDVVATIVGPARPILTGERTALNFLQRLSGVATMTRRFVDAVAGTGATILDTRKTTPGFRLLEKAAVRAGGGGNHRIGLYDMVLIKDNHIAAAGGITAAVRRVREHDRAGLPIEVEVTNLAELDEAIDAGVDRILLDNMDLETMRAAVERVRERAGEGRPRPLLEASGNITIDRVRAVAETGVDLISVGALTHSAPALDLSLRIDVA
jgi:nicotinate-nucleotide pyrophosphorylase (carboxylating)